MRGKLTPVTIIFPPSWITPACAGKTGLNEAERTIGEDHPRMCGENSVVPSSASSNKGSPPHVRGKPTIKSRLAQAMGITPACAGKTFVQALQISICQDHPRMCGENRHLSNVNLAGPGSPPHVRGKLESLGTIVGKLGITPACAGKT